MTGKWSVNELENDFLIASIVGTGKSIAFIISYILIKVGYYP